MSRACAHAARCGAETYAYRFRAVNGFPQTSPVQRIADEGAPVSKRAEGAEMLAGLDSRKAVLGQTVDERIRGDIELASQADDGVTRLRRQLHLEIGAVPLIGPSLRGMYEVPERH